MPLQQRSRARARSPRHRPDFSAAALEPRLLLATLSGTVYNDVNADGNRVALGEPGLGAWTVYVDGNENGAFDAGELNAASAAGGAWSITSAGFRTRQTYHVRVAPQSGWRLTEPAAGEYAVTFSALTDTAAGLDFGQTRRALVTGTVFNDENDDGNFDRGEAVLSGRTVFADANDNGALDAGESSDVTNSSGDYALFPAAGTYTIRQVQQTGWWQTFPSPPSAGHPVTVATAQSTGGGNFGNVVATVDLFGAGFAVTSPAAPVPADGKLDVFYQVRNSGTADSPGFRADFYLSADATITTADTLLRSIAQGSVPRHATVDRTTTLTLPTPDPFRDDNRYHVGMIVDSEADVAETNESNNSNRGPLVDSFPISSEGDLPAPVDNTTVVARPLTFGVEVQSGLGDEWIGPYDIDTYRFAGIAGHEIHFYTTNLDDTPLYDASWNLVKTFNVGGTLFVLPSTGTYYVPVAWHGTTYDPRRLTGRQASLGMGYSFTIWDRAADLAAQGIQFSAQPPGPLLLTYDLVNNGVLDPSPFNVRFFLSEDDSPSPNDTALATVRVTQPGGYHGQVQVTLPGTDPYRTDNQYWILMHVDADNEVAEVDETDNTDRASLVSDRSTPSPAPGGFFALRPAPSFGVPLEAAIGDEWIGPFDLDVFTIVAHAGERMSFDLDRTGGTLDSDLRLYDEAWTLLDHNDNAAAPGEPAGTDSFLEHLFASAGVFYLVVSSRGNHTSDPQQITGRTAAATGTYSLTVAFEPAAPVTGTVFADDNGNGVRDPGETGLGGWQVYLPIRDRGIFSINDRSTLTDATGAFTFTDVRPDTYYLEAARQAGWERTAPARPSIPLTLGSGQSAGPLAFGFLHLASVAGIVFDDPDGDGTPDAGESGQAGQMIYADLNNNGVRDVTTVVLNAAGLPVAFGSTIESHIEVIGYSALRIADVDVHHAESRGDSLRIDIRSFFTRRGGPGVTLSPRISSTGPISQWYDDEQRHPGPNYKPPTPLSIYDGAPPDGEWTLTVVNESSLPGPMSLDSWAFQLTLSEPFAVTDAQGNYTIPDLQPGEYRLNVETDPAASGRVWTSPVDGVHSISLGVGQTAATLHFGSRQRQLRVTGRHIFYNNSAFDGRDPAAGASDDTAIATEKSLIGSTPATTSGILTGYAGGINGIMVDVDELLAAPTLADFSFKVPDPANPFAWLDAPAPAGFAVRPIEPSDPTRRRVTFTWPDNRLRNTWLQVSVLANAATRRIAPDIFYVGNLVGETVVVTPTRVTAADLSATRAAISRARASVNSPFDHNRDGWVNVRDVEVVRATLGNVLPALVLPQSPAAAALTPQRSAPTRRTSLASDLLAEQKM